MSESAGSLTFQVYNCPVRELAQRYPQYFCGNYEEGFKDGLLEACSGKLSITRSKCLCDGDGCCEFEIYET